MSYDRRITPVRADLADERLRGQVDAAAFVSPRVMRVSAPLAPLRRNPSHDAALDTEALMGESVSVYDEHEGWAWVQLQTDGYVGYLPSAMLSAQAPAPTHKIGAMRSFLFPGPNFKLPPQGFLSFGAQVSVSAEEGDYARLSSGAFISRTHLAPLETKESDFVEVGERFLRTPYLWGGKSSLGIDCSGLAQTALAAVGISVPRDSDMQQLSVGESLPLDLTALRRGDLIFWKGHVGIMIDGTRLLHANAHAMMVTIEPLLQTQERVMRRSDGPIVAIRRL